MPGKGVAGDICLRRPRPTQGCRADDDDDDDDDDDIDDCCSKSREMFAHRRSVECSTVLPPDVSGCARCNVQHCQFGLCFYSLRKDSAFVFSFGILYVRLAFVFFCFVFAARFCHEGAHYFRISNPSQWDGICSGYFLPLPEGQSPLAGWIEFGSEQTKSESESELQMYSQVAIFFFNW